ncbi:MAG: 2Fe-2S iron-sulfur cluster binding domain-containing protein [Planctomycetes bacterium]|nr:2Fe-2S iron-sulfur cluster binding domain-containing protein [Planctomycetota bacterium]
MSETRLCVRGDARTFRLSLGESILDAAMAQGLALDHACGGVCACSTCHVKITAGRQCFSEPSEDELDQLDEARDVSLDSRLGCQAKLERLPPGGSIEITIPNWNVNAVREGGH